MSSGKDTSTPGLGRFVLFGVTVLVALGCGGLGSWQLRRLEARRARNVAAQEQRRLPLLDLDRERLDRVPSYRPVALRGELDPEHQFVLRSRAHRGTPGVHVVTPLKLIGRDTAVLVDRGFIPTPDAGPPASLADYGEPGVQALTGYAFAIPDDGEGWPVVTPRGESWQRLDLTAMRRRLPYPIAAYYVVAGTGGSARAGYPIRVAPPEPNDGPHLGYAIQWFLIGIVAVGCGVAFVRKGGEGRRGVSATGQRGAAPPPP